MIQYHIIPDNQSKNLVGIIKKISDYFISFTGDIQVKSINEGQIEIIYSNTSFTAEAEVDGDKIVLTTHEDDSITINLIKNIASNSGFRIFNIKHGYFLPNDPKLMDISSIGIDKKIYEIFKKEGLTPLFQYRDSYIYFCLNKKKEVVLINRHYLEYLVNNEDLIRSSSTIINNLELTTIIAKDIATFIALFDRGLISLVFQKYQNSDTKVINLSGFDMLNIPKNSLLQVTNFRLNKDRQMFIQESTTDKIVDKKYLSMKINQDYSYKIEGKKLYKIINVSAFYSS